MLYQLSDIPESSVLIGLFNAQSSMKFTIRAKQKSTGACEVLNLALEIFFFLPDIKNQQHTMSDFYFLDDSVMRKDFILRVLQSGTGSTFSGIPDSGRPHAPMEVVKSQAKSHVTPRLKMIGGKKEVEWNEGRI